MRGGQIFMEALVANGVDRIFGNPGTTENSILDRLIDFPSIEYIVALHEGVAVGAASFYAQASGRAGVANLHVAPGLGNGIGMMYGALKAESPLIVTAGAQDTRLRLRSPILGHDLVAMAAPVTKWSIEPQSADEMAPILQRAFQIACEPPCGPVFVALPNNVMEQESAFEALPPLRIARASSVAPAVLEQAREMLATADNPIIIAGDGVVHGGAFDQLVQLAEAIGAPVHHSALRCQLTFPNRHPNYRGRIPFEAKAARTLLAEHDVVCLIGGPFLEEIWFDPETAIPEDARVLNIESNAESLNTYFPIDLSIAASLPALLGDLAASLDSSATARQAAMVEQAAQRSAASAARVDELRGSSPMAPAVAIAEIARGVPDNVVVVDESITASTEVAEGLDLQRPGDLFAGRGGGIGQGIAGALGVQVANPDRPVLALSGDGSAMYSIQALWTAAHHQLPMVFVILSNREYRVLKHNLDIYRTRFAIESNKPYPHMDLTNPQIGFSELAAGMGVVGELVTDVDQVADAVRRAFAAGGPRLVEIVVSGKEYGQN